MKATLPIPFSHITEDFCTPLSLLIESLEQVNKGNEIPNDLKEEISVIQCNARQLLRLINQLPKPDNPFLEQIYQLIEKHLDQPELNVGTLAECMNMNRRTLNRKLITLLNLSAHEVIKQYRLEKAALLLQSGYSVSETAYSVGFETPSYFSSVFKEFYNICPSEFAGTKKTDRTELKNEG